MIADRVKTTRERQKLTVRQLAAKCLLSPESIYKIENGETKNPGVDTLQKIADALGCTVHELIPVHEQGVV